MSQRLFASRSALLTKGVALKAGDWSFTDLTEEGSENNSRIKRSESATSIASLQTQVDIQCSSSTSFASNSMIKSRSFPALLNAICDEKECSASLLRQPQSNTPKPITDVKSNICPSIGVRGRPSPVGAILFSNVSRLTIRGRPSMPNLSSLAEETEEDFSIKPIPQCPPCLLDSIALKTGDPFKKETSCPKISSDQCERPLLRSRLSMPNLSSQTETEEEGLLFKKYKYPISLTNNNTRATVVETFAKKAPRHIDVLDIDSSDLASLKEDDPFMYYSIPAIRNASWNGEHLDLPLLQDSDVLSGSSIYERKSCISFEPWSLSNPSDHVDDMDGYFIPSEGNAFFDFNSDDDIEDEDPVDAFLFMAFSRGIV